MNVPASATEAVYCAECRRESKAEKVAPVAVASDTPVSLSGDDILTVICQLCQSSLLVNEAKVGTQIICPDCHSSIVVQRTTKRPKRQIGRPRPAPTKKRFDPEAELSLEEPAERPAIDPLFGLDEVTEDLLSAPLPEVDPSLVDSPEPDESLERDGGGDDSTEDGQTLTRRQRYERMQQRIISEGRKKMRDRGRAKQTARKDKAALGDAGDDRSNRAGKKKRRRRRRGGDQESQSRSWVNPAFGWFRRSSLVVGWVLSTVFLSVAYGADINWSPVMWLDRWYVMLTQSPIVVDFRLVANSILFVAGSLYLYYLCGRSFAMNARAESDSNEKASDVSSLFTTFHFTLAWLLAGLPFLYWSILFLPIQLLIVPPLLVGSWLNQSVWRFVRSDGLIAAEDPKPDRQLWYRIYGQAAVAAVVACGPVLMVRAGGVLSAFGCLLLGGIMIGTAGVIGWHCRELSKSLEPSP